jgi:hypothetical protein|tara:strand:- start:556 stop:723 length:168 start_codon:yes stop_codon:yes gene_type:complete
MEEREITLDEFVYIMSAYVTYKNASIRDLSLDNLLVFQKLLNELIENKKNGVGIH